MFGLEERQAVVLWLKRDATYKMLCELRKFVLYVVICCETFARSFPGWKTRPGGDFHAFPVGGDYQ